MNNTKKISLLKKQNFYRNFVLLVAVTIVISWMNACSKSDNSSGTTPAGTGSLFGNTPTANAQYNNSAAGIYKGVVTGSSGYYAIYIKNSDNRVFALLNFDSIHDSLVCPALNAYVPGSNTNITNAIFTSATGTLDSIILSVNANGTNAQVQVIIPGHTTAASINKETSSAVVKLYQGNAYDTLVAGYFYNPCGNSTKSYPPTIKVSNLNSAVQGNVCTIVIGVPYLPAGYNNGNCLNSGGMNILSINANNQLDFNADPGCSNAHAIINVTDSVISGTIICPRPYTPGTTTCFDWYNSYIRVVRVN